MIESNDLFQFSSLNTPPTASIFQKTGLRCLVFRPSINAHLTITNCFSHVTRQGCCKLTHFIILLTLLLLLGWWWVTETAGDFWRKPQEQLTCHCNNGRPSLSTVWSVVSTAAARALSRISWLQQTVCDQMTVPPQPPAFAPSSVRWGIPHAKPCDLIPCLKAARLAIYVFAQSPHGSQQSLHNISTHFSQSAINVQRLHPGIKCFFVSSPPLSPA